MIVRSVQPLCLLDSIYYDSAYTRYNAYKISNLATPARAQCRGPCLKLKVRAALIQHTRVARMRLLRFTMLWPKWVLQ